jgi:hypothetical protein
LMAAGRWIGSPSFFTQVSERFRLARPTIPTSPVEGSQGAHCRTSRTRISGAIVRAVRIMEPSRGGEREEVGRARVTSELWFTPTEPKTQGPAESYASPDHCVNARSLAYM